MKMDNFSAAGHSSDLTDQEQLPRYKIGTVAGMVGVTANVLRAWERRYEILKPARQLGKQRLYSDQDIRLLQRIVETLERGLSISEAVALGRDRLLSESLPTASAPTRPETRLFAVPDTVRTVIEGLAPDLGAPPASPRYAGEALDVSVRALALCDLVTLHRVYHAVKGLYELWTYMDYQPVVEIVARRLALLDDPQLRSQVHQLGAATAKGDSLLTAALHDAREGALALLLGRRQEWDRSGRGVSGSDLLISLARDHAKVLRNAFSDLDPALREADEHLKAHQIVPILSKIDHLRSGGWIDAIGSDFNGFISCRCLETSALDRLLYRFLAMFRDVHGAPPPNLWVTERPNGWVRWVFEAPMRTAEMVPGGDFVARVVGLTAGIRPERALEEGYFGARRTAGRDWLWFHWPSYDPPPEVSRCGCHPLS
jgi:hypothetical protein